MIKNVQIKNFGRTVSAENYPDIVSGRESDIQSIEIEEKPLIQVMKDNSFEPSDDVIEYVMKKIAT